MSNKVSRNKLLMAIICMTLLVVIYYILTLLTSDSKLPKIEAPIKNKLSSLPDFSNIQDVAEKKETFFKTLYPIIETENTHILKLRSTIISLQNASELDENQKEWLLAIAKNFKIESTSVNEELFSLLLVKVDYIPPSLALTQAAIESGWGSSRFSKQGNNLFGQWCFSKGCGMVPNSRDSGKAHEVSKFASVNHAVRAYMLNLNSNNAYQTLRDKRASIRNQEGSLTGIALAQTLTKYSEEGPLYVSKVTKFINQNKLQRFTKQFEATLVATTE